MMRLMEQCTNTKDHYDDTSRTGQLYSLEGSVHRKNEITRI